MEVVMGVMSGVILKLGDLLVGQYKLQKGVKGEMLFLQPELESMRGALKEITKGPLNQLDSQDKIWASEVRELCYDIEDSIDTFVVRCKGGEPAKPDGMPAKPDAMKEFIHRSMDLLTRIHIRHKIATDIRDIKRRVVEVCERRERYKIDGVVAKPATVDPRLLALYTKVTELVGIDEARDELIKIMTEENEASTQQGKIVSIVGFGGLGKTTLANAVYQKIRAQFDYSAFVSVSQTPDMRKLFKGMLYELGKNINEETLDERQLIDEIRKFLQMKRYCIVIDDIWDISVWKMVRCALPDDIGGCIIITTTRIFKVAEEVGGAYKIKPLSPHNSRILLYGRIFGNEYKDKCPDKQLAEVSDRILKKCAGVPLAIITIASLLASKGENKMVWHEVCHSIDSGLENSQEVEKMRMILSLSYYDLPSNLRTCLLYLGVFPEDYKIRKDRLIWMWIAEGFIQCKKHGKSSFELGESYFYELINRSMIQLMTKDNDKTEYCYVHDMILDLIRSLSSEENFVTLLNDVDCTSPSTRVRRLSLQNSKVDHAIHWATMSMEQVRSVVAFPSAVNILQMLPSYKVLRVLDLEDCDISRGCHLKCLGSLFHLRYLRLHKTRIVQLPEEIGNLQCLQTLDVRSNNISRLPSTVVQLRDLLCLQIDPSTRVPNTIGSLTSLEELSVLRIHNSVDTIEELGHLTKLRVLEIDFSTEWKDTLEKSLVECLCKLRKIQHLKIWVHSYKYNCKLDSWATPPLHLRRLELWGCWFSTLPDWMNPSLLLDLAFLDISRNELQHEDLEILGRLPALRYLYLGVDHEYLRISRRSVVGAGSFPCLVECRLYGFEGPVVFRHGAMPRLAKLMLGFHVREMREVASTNGGFDLGLGNLPSLQVVTVRIYSRGASKEEVEEAKAALKHAAEIHPNHPNIRIYDF